MPHHSDPTGRDPVFVRGQAPPAPGGPTEDGQVERALHSDAVPRLHGLIDLISRQKYPTSKEELIHRVGARPLYLLPDIWVPVADILNRVPEEAFRSSAELKEWVAAHWPSLSPRPPGEF